MTDGQCPETTLDLSTVNGSARCQYSAGHNGDHQHVNPDRTLRWRDRAEHHEMLIELDFALHGTGARKTTPRWNALLEEVRTLAKARAVTLPFILASSSVRSCRECGCTDNDCSECVARTGMPCMWIETDLCSACADDEEPCVCGTAFTCLATKHTAPVAASHELGGES